MSAFSTTAFATSAAADAGSATTRPPVAPPCRSPGVRCPASASLPAPTKPHAGLHGAPPPRSRRSRETDWKISAGDVRRRLRSSQRRSPTSFLRSRTSRRRRTSARSSSSSRWSPGFSRRARLLGDAPIALTARVVVVLVAAGAFVAHAFTTPRDDSVLHPFTASFAPRALPRRRSPRASWATRSRRGDELRRRARACLAAIVWLVDRVCATPSRCRGRSGARGSPCHGHRIVGDDVAWPPPTICVLARGSSIEAGEVVPVDATVVAGSGTVIRGSSRRPLPRVTKEIRSSPAPARHGRLRAIAGGRASTAPSCGSLTIRAAVQTSTRRSHVSVAMPPRAAASSRPWSPRSLLSRRIGRASRSRCSRAPRTRRSRIAASRDRGASRRRKPSSRALERGVVFRTADALDRAGRVGTAAFCARGTLLLGEPEVARHRRILRHAAGSRARAGGGNGRGARAPGPSRSSALPAREGSRADGVRSPTLQPGLGVTASQRYADSRRGKPRARC